MLFLFNYTINVSYAILKWKTCFFFDEFKPQLNSCTCILKAPFHCEAFFADQHNKICRNKRRNPFEWRMPKNVCMEKQLKQCFSSINSRYASLQHGEKSTWIILLWARHELWLTLNPLALILCWKYGRCFGGGFMFGQWTRKCELSNNFFGWFLMNIDFSRLTPLYVHHIVFCRRKYWFFRTNIHLNSWNRREDLDTFGRHVGGWLVVERFTKLRTTYSIHFIVSDFYSWLWAENKLSSTLETSIASQKVTILWKQHSFSVSP